MIRWLLHHIIAKFEQRMSYDATYMHEIADVSRGAAGRKCECQGKIHRCFYPPPCAIDARPGGWPAND